MKSLLRRCIEVGIHGPASCLRSLRRYEPLATIRSQQAPHVLLIASHWIGDTLWAAQVVPKLRCLWPEGQLACVTKPVCLPLWSGNLAVDRRIESTAVVSDRKRETTTVGALRRLGDELGRSTWDLVIDLTGNRYSALLTHWIHARHTLGFDGGELGALYATSVRDAQRAGRHLSERPFRVIEPLLGTFSAPQRMNPPSPNEPQEARRRRCGLDPGKPVAVLAPAAGWPEKEWGDRHFSHIAYKLCRIGYSVVLIDHPAGRSRLETIAAAGGGADGALRILVEPSIDPAMTLLSGCDLFVGNDSGLGHIAAALGRLTVSIFTGATDPALCAPLGADAHVLRAGDPDHVWEAIRTLLGRGAQPAPAEEGWGGGYAS